MGRRGPKAGMLSSMPPHAGHRTSGLQPPHSAEAPSSPRAPALQAPAQNQPLNPSPTAGQSQESPLLCPGHEHTGAVLPGAPMGSSLSSPWQGKSWESSGRLTALQSPAGLWGIAGGQGETRKRWPPGDRMPSVSAMATRARGAWPLSPALLFLLPCQLWWWLWAMCPSCARSPPRRAPAPRPPACKLAPARPPPAQDAEKPSYASGISRPALAPHPVQGGPQHAPLQTNLSGGCPALGRGPGRPWCPAHQRPLLKAAASMQGQPGK